MGITIHSKKLIEDKYPEIFLTFSGFSGFPLEKKKGETCSCFIKEHTDEWKEKGQNKNFLGLYKALPHTQIWAKDRQIGRTAIPGAQKD